MNKDKIDTCTLSDLFERGLSEDEISNASPDQLFCEYCNWHGLYGWGNALIEVLDNLRAACDESNTKSLVSHESPFEQTQRK